MTHEINPRYQNGKIYRLIEITDEPIKRVYIGSTCETLERRFRIHKDNKYDKIQRCSAYTIINNCLIELIEDYPCNSEWELHRKEREHILKTKEDSTVICINVKVPARTNEERVEYHRLHYENNKYRILSYQSEKITCECGLQIGRGYLSKHRKTKVHLSRISPK